MSAGNNGSIQIVFTGTGVGDGTSVGVGCGVAVGKAVAVGVGGVAAGEQAASANIKPAHNAMIFFAGIDQKHLCCFVAGEPVDDCKRTS